MDPTNCTFPRCDCSKEGACEAFKGPYPGEVRRVSGRPPFPMPGAAVPTYGAMRKVDDAAKQMLLPKDPAQRKAIPIATGVLDYFPLALAYVSKVSKAGNDQHNPGQPLHWDKSKSKDHADCIARHLIDRGTVDTSDAAKLLHSGKLAWRALALLETELGNGSLL